MKIKNFEADTLVKLIGIASDIALVMDHQGIIQDVSVRNSELAALGCSAWLGRSWAQTASLESRPKIEEMLSPKNTGEDIRWRHVNHLTPQGMIFPLQYAVLPLGHDGTFLALGRDLEAVAVLQRRLVETQQSMERDYLRLRHIEARYRILFDTSGEAVMVVDGGNYRVVEANVGAQAIVKDSNKRLVGRDIVDCFDPDSREEILSLLRMAHATGRIEMCRSKFIGSQLECTVSATVFRQESGAQFLVRIVPQESKASTALSRQQTWFSEALERSPDGFVLTDRAGAVKSANAEFLLMIGATALSQLQSQSLENWLVRGGVDWGVLSTNLRQQAVVKDFATEVRTMAGLAVPVEISALTLSNDETNFAFYIRDVARKRQPVAASSNSMAGSVAELSHLVGRLPMKDIVGETIDMIEKMCIQSALELTHNNRASAAEMLGLSRQSLYVKLRRFGMVGDSDGE
jgi:transcriptional regulator PpsR